MGPPPYLTLLRGVEQHYGACGRLGLIESRESGFIGRSSLLEESLMRMTTICQLPDSIENCEVDSGAFHYITNCGKGTGTGFKPSSLKKGRYNGNGDGEQVIWRMCGYER